MTTDRQALRARLTAAGCTHKLYPARLRALELVTGQRLMPQVAEVIEMRIVGAGAASIGYKRQFQRDFKTYGLLEAILYFHSYPPLDGDFVEEACALYERLAALYLEHHDRIEASDDPRVLAHLLFLQRLGDPGHHVGPVARRLPRSAPYGIAAPSQPAGVPGYERKLAVHPDLAELGILEFPASVAEELVEHLSGSFMFEGFPGIQVAFFDVARALDDHGVQLFGSDGQYVLDTLVDYLGQEMFGDFDRWIPCIECGEQFFVEVTLDSVNKTLLAGGWTCDSCRGRGNGRSR